MATVIYLHLNSVKLRCTAAAIIFSVVCGLSLFSHCCTKPEKNSMFTVTQCNVCLRIVFVNVAARGTYW